MKITARLQRNAKVALLRRVPLFARCSNRDLGRIASLADELHVRDGHTLTAEGKPGREFMVLVDGSAEVRRKGRRVAVLGPGDFLGEIALVTNRPRTATVTTTSPVRLLVLTERDFRTLLRDVPTIQAKVLEAVAARVPAETV
ncbi:MAG TPA: cyclic nucleotide-binding domain-containing protein [Gaiellaceae bacterium]|nr:cyclic nucleotide-binding domain-containing protein [Gaiellaceae bacterium]